MDYAVCPPHLVAKALYKDLNENRSLVRSLTSRSGRARQASPIFFTKVRAYIFCKIGLIDGGSAAALFLSQGHVLTPSSTLYTVFFGIK
jgi:hypothetical protein